MVGHILGLGDRHPSNLLIERSSGKVVHIDFGDCFEVAMHREKFPEKIPFRLTRMLTNAMEASCPLFCGDACMLTVITCPGQRYSRELQAYL
jgi:phosphatidylinositol kinase/protein kinase (PI-3  family)